MQINALNFGSYADISFVGINSQGKIEIVSLEPKDEKCTIPNFPVKSRNVLIRDLDESVHLYDGHLGIHRFEHNSGSWKHVTNLKKRLSRHGEYVN